MTEQKTVKVEMDMPYIEGYEYTGEYREPINCETFLDDGYVSVKNLYDDYDAAYPILRKKRWRAEVGGKYCAVQITNGKVKVRWFLEQGSAVDNLHYERDMYFKAEQEAQELADKLQAVIDDQ